MKIRILNNSIRFRLSQGEVAEFMEKGKVEAKIQFGSQSDEALVYAIEKKESGELSAIFSSGHIRVFVPKEKGEIWATTAQVGMEHSKKIDQDHTLHILVEKDFKCLTVRPGEDESDNFPNPSQSC